MLFIPGGFGWPFSFIFPIIFFFIGIRVLRHLFGGRSHRSFERERIREEMIPDTRYHVGPKPQIPDSTFESRIFRLADEMKGRLTVSDIVIAMDLGIKEAERRIEEMVDGMHVSIDVTESGRVIYEFPEIIARYESDDRDDRFDSLK